MDSSSTQPEKKSIPRFASFKPQLAPPPKASERRSRDSSEREDRSRHHSKHRHSRHKHHRDRSSSRDRRRDRREQRHGRKQTDRPEREHTDHRSTPQIAVNKSEDDPSDLYVVDRKGDRYNIVYGTIHRYNVPRYHRVGRGSVLGLPPSYKIDRDTVEGDPLVVRTDAWRADGSRTRAKSIISALSTQGTKLLRIRQVPESDAADDASKDYIPLDASKRRKRADASDGEYSEDEKNAYRSIHGKAKPEDDIPSDLEATSDTDRSGDETVRADPDKEIRQRNVELSRVVDRNPADVNAWIELIDYQETLLKGSERESKSLTYAERKSLADIKVSLYEKALKKVGEHPSRDLLLLGYLQEGSKHWDTKKLSVQWQTVLKANSHFISLWVKYLDFRQTEFLDFTYGRCFATFIDCLKLNKSAPDSPGKAHVQIYLFLRLTLFIREAGFAEHAVGLWQAVLELTFFGPETLDVKDRDEALSAFTDFWESEVARIGEVGAKGWKSEQNSLLDPKSFMPQYKLIPKFLFPSWEACENERAVNARLPARSLDEEDDPYRVILPTDLQETVSLVWASNAEDVLIDSFLYFCHLPPIAFSGTSSITSRWMGDSFLRNDFMGSPDTTLDNWLPNHSTGTRSSTSAPAYVHNFIHSFDTLFANPESWFSSFEQWAKTALSQGSKTDPDWVLRVLRLLIAARPSNDNLIEYSLAMEFACDRSKATKYAKSLLKKRPSSLWLYNAYALMEHRSGNIEAANRVWETTLSMTQSSKAFSESDKIDAVLLWNTCVWEALELGNLDQASHILTSMSQNGHSLNPPQDTPQSTFSPTNLLKIHNQLSSNQETALATRRIPTFTTSTDTLALTAYLSHSRDLPKALQPYNHALHRLTNLPTTPQTKQFQQTTTEVLHQARARLIHYHARTSTLYKPSQIRTLLQESITLSPHNTIFLSLFSWNESRFRIEERVRDTIKSLTTQPTLPVTTHLFSIFTELNRPTIAGSTAHSVRAAFEKAIGDHDIHATHTTLSTARSNLTLWKLYILFELSQLDIRRAKEVFYRGMRACPWSKDLVMLAFSHLRADVVEERYPVASRRGDGMGFLELRNVYNVLVEKELRIHVEIEEELDEIVARMQQRTADLGVPITMPEDADSEDEQMQL
ncbi:NRDE-2, necessary for RNA interference-domain-containing protein [Aspergillus avenaceus]|uniref:NRDE-2, necessary for RNA interference-domain-containing protein n=1 Tax=Aspergillus avenaceus TaxID=36643 RepID=A0A5N6TN06_ASPAV|nr:NRDE-2, necessary for RNA interference-domain-containing protein [Aspergillus avenaceus]